jgi:hypothetical protein
MNQKLRKALISALLTGTNYVARDHGNYDTYWGYVESPTRIEPTDKPGEYRYCGGVTVSLNMNGTDVLAAELFPAGVDVIDLHELLHLHGTSKDFQEVYNLLHDLQGDLSQHDPSVGIFAAPEDQLHLISLLAELIKPEEVKSNA